MLRVVDFGDIDLGEEDVEITDIVVDDAEDKIEVKITLALKLRFNKQPE